MSAWVPLRPAAGTDMAFSLFDVPNSSPVSMLEKTMAFTEQRNRVLAENVANILTPGYRAKQLDVPAFQKALQEASEKRARRGGAFQLESTREFHTDEGGMLELTPSEEPPENLLFQDGTNTRIERQMALLAENTMMAQASVNLLQQYYRTISEAIRGRVT
jgi:flagellar basal-body rod protein FlgB